jgi:hypothetical protein
VFTRDDMATTPDVHGGLKLANGEAVWLLITEAEMVEADRDLRADLVGLLNKHRSDLPSTPSAVTSDQTMLGQPYFVTVPLGSDDHHSGETANPR